ncbi:MAG: hypothetical protein QOF59_214, partial [Actinomycetota bacterium]|nr:hypothetical protein [Actinomycetota bacterium]
PVRGVDVAKFEREVGARAVLGIVDWVGIMLRGRITNFGTPAAMEAELSTAYLGE